MLLSLKERGIADKTAIIVTADHGESIAEHGIYLSHHGLYDPTFQVPLVIDEPGFSGQEEGLVQHVDLAPTIMDLFGAEYDDAAFDGRSLLADGDRTIDREAVLLEERSGETKQAIRTEGWKYVRSIGDRAQCRYCHTVHGGEQELYDLETDPEEATNLVGDDPEQATELRDRLDITLASLLGPTGEDTTGEEMNEEALQRLDDLGYI